MLKSGTEGLADEEEVVSPPDVEGDDDGGKERGSAFLRPRSPDVDGPECRSDADEAGSAGLAPLVFGRSD